MILVNLTVDGGLGFLVLVLDDGLVHDSWGNLLVNGSVVVTSLGPREKNVSWLVGKSKAAVNDPGGWMSNTQKT